MTKKLRVGIIYGGKSGEHEVSLQTAKAVIDAFDLTKYELFPFYITPDGKWRNGEKIERAVENVDQLRLKSSALEPSLLGSLFCNMYPQAIDANDARDNRAKGLDVVLPLLHGTYGEDGTIQGLLEMAHIPYVGAGVLASAVGMDKVMMKKIFAQEGLPQCIFRHFTQKQWQNDPSYFLMEMEIAIGYPCFVKPANLGSSVGISKAGNREQLIQAIETAFKFDRKVIVEEAIDAREIEVAVLGNDTPSASVAGEVVSSNSFYDYKAKYIDGTSTIVIPAELPEKLADELRSLAIKAFRAIDGSGLSRVDFFVRKNDHAIMINEINTMPGFTPYSMYPMLWKETGVSYQELLDRLIQLALERYNEKQQLMYGSGQE